MKLLSCLGFSCLVAVHLTIGDLPFARAANPDAEGIEFFEKKIRPVLVNHCYRCHSQEAENIRGGLLLDNRAAIRQGGPSGATIVPGDAENSLLLRALRYTDNFVRMPPDGKLPEDVVADFEQWVKMGAPDPRDGDVVLPAEGVDIESASGHWAFQLPQKSPLPEIQDTGWPRTAVDHYILARLESKGLQPSPEADRRTLIRRLYFDLIGLPPTYEEVEAFVADESSAAYESVVDRLLGSQHFGERWARHWLDVARYSDTKGYVFQEDRNYPDAYQYRDWVVQSLNEDLPYDEFLLQQIAADHLPEDQQVPVAMGFLTLGRRFINNMHDIIDDRIDVVTRGTMGLTVSCARCHDHKHDPIPIEDYYSLYGVFFNSRESDEAPTHLKLVDVPEPRNVRVFLRGDPRNRGEEVPRQFLEILSGDEREPFEYGSGRLELAQAIASPENPLTARVMVNRVWAHLLGEGLVDTPSDFGLRSEPPSHPDVLDYLALRFVDEGWSVKQLIRQIVLSSVYRQTSDERPQAAQVDPENRLLWRANRRRMDLEAMRDALLAASGQIDMTVGGPAEPLTSEPFSLRRTLYGFIDRQNLPNLFRTFDFASPDTHTPQRLYTSVPQQALYLLNSPFAMQQAEQLAARPEVVEQQEPEERIAQLYRLTFGRDATKEEIALGREMIESAMAEEEASEPELPRWQYGYGRFDEQSQRVEDFQPLPHWTGDAWQGGPDLPDPELGWVILNRQGGHPGGEHAVVRRWLAPAEGTISISGRLKHPSEEGDGVRSRIVSSRSGVAGEWTAQHSETDTTIETLQVQQGDTIDFVTDCRSNPSHDGFQWTVAVRIEAQQPLEQVAWNSAENFQGPVPSPLGPWGRYAQILLMANEFVFVD